MAGYAQAENHFVLENNSKERELFGPVHDQFKLGKRLGKGGQATVYECTRLGTDKTYAVKVIDMKALKFQKHDGEQNLRREIRNMEELFHPRIVNLLTHIYEENRCWLVMDLARGGDLHNKVFEELNISINRGDDHFPGLGRSELASRHVAQQLLDGMGYMHSNGVVHRDMKLENVLISRTYSYPGPAEQGIPTPSEVHDVKITDFGLSKNMHSAPLVRRATAVGSPDFVAPEVLHGVCDQSCDYWSFGVMIYAMICGEWPFTIRSKKDLVPERHKEVVSCIKASKSWQHASTEVHELVQGLLNINMAGRFSHVDCVHHSWFSSCTDMHKMVGKVSFPENLALKDGEPRAVIQEISGCTGYAVDNLQLKLRSGKTLTFGSAGGDIQQQWKLRPDERIIAVLQEERHDFLGLALVFHTSRGDVLALQGAQARKRRSFIAPAGSSIVGLQFQGHRLIGIHLEKISMEEPGCVASLGGRVGHAVDKVWFRLRDGTTREYGSSDGGVEHGPWVLEPGEHIVAVEQLVRDAFLGTSLAFYTTTGSIFCLKGMEAFGSRRFSSLPGRQICGLHFEGSMIVSVSTCADDGNLDAVKTHRMVC
ncbi:unnamed protein product [Effrenium voratum]|uniref:Protein kinase domain-containing protein n=1 Tax=Effrenium voratum TaxID=2562239 RepID=A0AA36MRU7_9DINO|nr:unnamed protein product [Effrenium voratum]CAJ1383340.1 unnamed protein product [Effrenium voratum]CAJ1440023.1 unnamed protein product [Effrenium voratum]|mmetsp:Transcript_11657/g.27501  ORF Transcript_11657/g.27501 Transcript_11657/m.27501 type:complete len:595 (-) Transcript_11657:41-1825(-)|eukprot:CAMPEP_0181437330 /NCGR_PEP_ID=MMETSP1110-20121109/21321_1 /TAXON_ID=174948 /ORGANISM="Symbiodinium sp., Strain CCMP421" /LENGTH=594 /DNA_ID=CAMNT_0023560949 /DNA_START=60 /DNA_END=1844 /DNA_ORIENTATION=+